MASTSMGGHSERLTREITVYLRFAVCFHCLRLSLEAEHFRRVGGGGRRRERWWWVCFIAEKLNILGEGGDAGAGVGGGCLFHR